MTSSRQNRKAQRKALESALDASGIDHIWTTIDLGECALVDLGGGYDAELWVPNVCHPYWPQHLKADVWLNGRTHVGMAYVDGAEDAADAIADARLIAREHAKRESIRELADLTLAAPDALRKCQRFS